MKLGSGRNSAVLLLTALVLALLFAVYYYVVLPKKEKVEMMENSITSLQNEITSIEEQLTAVEEEKNANKANVFEMRKKVPQTREIDELLLNIEESEYISGSRIVTVEFNNYDSLVAESEITNPYAPSEEETNAEEGSESEDESTSEDEQPVSPIATETLPPELKLITFEIEVESPDYERLLKFVKEIENIERIMHIDILEYELPGEEQQFEEDDEVILSATIQVTTFYYEGE